MRVLVLGANGFVGSHVCARLASEGHEVVAGVRDPQRFSSAITAADTVADRVRYTVVQFNLADPNSIAAAARNCDAIVHAAGTNSPATPEELCGAVDIAGLENVIAAANRKRISRLVYISCADVTLDRGPRVGWNEDDAPKHPPKNAWLDVKRIADNIASIRPDTFVLRPALLWGSGDCRLICRWRNEAAHGGIRLIGSGDHLISTTYIGNLVQAVCCALAADKDAAGVFHIVDAEMSRLSTFANELSQQMNWPRARKGAFGKWAWRFAALTTGNVQFAPHPIDLLSMTYSTSLDNARARTTLGYQPIYDRQAALTEMHSALTELSNK